MTHAPEPACLARVVLAGEALTRLSPLLERDRAQAVRDLEADNQFRLLPRGGEDAAPGPYRLLLSIQDGRLVFDLRDGQDTPLTAIVLALGPFRGLIKDYQLLVESHALAMAEGQPHRVQAIDMGRRGLHNEGAALLQQRLDGKATIDLPTARRLFTLVCVLHQRI